MLSAPRRIAGAVVALLFISSLAVAQDSVRVVPAPDSVHADTTKADTSNALPEIANHLKPPVTPTGAAVRSLLLPGWGQFKLKQPIMGSAFVASELVWLGLALKEQRQISNLRSISAADSLISPHTAKREDWLFILVLNHAVAGIEAYVTGHFWDFPKTLQFQKREGHGMTATMSIPIRIR